MQQQLLRKFLVSDRGSVESSLVIIPLLTLFLISTQISIAIHTRNMEKLDAQNLASRSGISGEFSSSDSFVHINSPDLNQNLDLVISHRERNIPQVLQGLSALLRRTPITEVTGIAIVENQR